MPVVLRANGKNQIYDCSSMAYMNTGTHRCHTREQYDAPASDVRAELQHSNKDVRLLCLLMDVSIPPYRLTCFRYHS